MKTALCSWQCTWLAVNAKLKETSSKSYPLLGCWLMLCYHIVCTWGQTTFFHLILEAYRLVFLCTAKEKLCSKEGEKCNGHSPLSLIYKLLATQKEEGCFSFAALLWHIRRGTTSLFPPCFFTTTPVLATSFADKIHPNLFTRTTRGGVFVVIFL